MTGRPLPAGVGLGWRPPFAAAPDAYPALAFAEVVADPLFGQPLPSSLAAWRARGLPVVPHGLGLSLGGAALPDPRRLAGLAELATRLGAPLVSEHVAFVRAGGLEAGHLMPVPRTPEALRVLVANVRLAQRVLPVPLALENGAPLADWPDGGLDEGAFWTALLAETGAWMVLDLANLHANAVNHGRDPVALLDRLPLDRVAYVHLAGGRWRAGRWEDSHADPVAPGALALLAALRARVGPVSALLERDDDFPPLAEVVGELGAIAAVLAGAEPPEAPAVAGAPATSALALTAPAGPPSAPATSALALTAPAGPPSAPAAVDQAPAPLPIAMPADLQALAPLPPAPAADRAALDAAEVALLRALLAGGPLPAGIDPAAAQAATAQLLRKRRRRVARTFPALAAALGDGFATAFAAHAARHPSVPADARADGLVFARALGPLPPAAVREVRLARARAARWYPAVARLVRWWRR